MNKTLREYIFRYKQENPGEYPEAIYLGHEAYIELIDKPDKKNSLDLKEQTFQGLPIVRVMEEKYIRVV